MTEQHWDDSFSNHDYVYGEHPNLFIEQMHAHIPPNAKVGCFAEGEGRNAVYLAKQGHDVTAYDYSQVGLEKTQTLAAKNKVDVQTVLMDLTKEQAAPAQFDAAIMVFGHVPKQDQAYLLQGILGAVRPGGIIMFEVYSDAQIAYNTGGPRDLNMLYNSKDVLEYLGDYQVLHFYYGEAKREEGKRHSGIGHVIQSVVQKPS